MVETLSAAQEGVLHGAVELLAVGLCFYAAKHDISISCHKQEQQTKKGAGLSEDG